MGLNANGFELALNALTDATTGINKIAVDLDLDGITASQAIAFDAAVGGASYGTVVSSSAVTFSITGGSKVTRLLLYNDTTLISTIENITEVTDSNDFDYVVDSVTITLT